MEEFALFVLRGVVDGAELEEAQGCRSGMCAS